ncbi:MAG: hypothetical protein ABH821_06135 [archaeon]
MKLNKQHFEGSLLVVLAAAFFGVFWITRNILVKTLSPEIINFY